MLIPQLIDQVSDKAERATVMDIRIGAHWTCVVFDVDGIVCAGLSSTLGGDHIDHHGNFPVKDAGTLHTYAPRDLLELTRSNSLTEASMGFASINALLDVDIARCKDVNAAKIIAEHGAGKHVAVVGHFPFIERLRSKVEQLWVLELNPRDGDLLTSEAPVILPQADVVAVTGTSLLNGTFEGLLSHCDPSAYIVVLGATTPLSPVLFEYGVNVISGTRVVDVDGVMRAVSQGATFRQIKGKRLLTMFSPS